MRINGKTLDQYRRLQAEIDGCEARATAYLDRIARIIDAQNAYNATELCEIDNVGAAQYNEEARQTIDLYRKLERLNAENRLHLVRMQYEIEQYLFSIPDPDLRRAFALHYLNGKTWLEVAAALYTTEDNIKKRVYRYMRKHFNDCADTATE